MIDIKDIQGNIVQSVSIAESALKVEELMSNDCIQLSWNSDSSNSLPIGSYIEHEGERYSLLEPYTPSQKNEAEFVYTPQFKSRVMAWGKKPFFFYSGESKEPDWTLTSNPADFMRCVCDAIKEETGEGWSYSIDASLPASASLSFTSVDILSGLNQIAGAFETEWFADKSTNTIYLGLLSHGEEVTLEVGNNINVPSVQGSREGYYTRFYAFGSTRNITQDYEGSNTNNLVNKRLTLDPAKYPDGYKDIRSGLSEGEIFSKVLIFDDVYPSANLSISGVRNRLMYRLDTNGDKVQVGTDSEGNPIYDQYAIWYFRIDGFDFDLSNIIEGYNLSVSFQSGALQGREFELKYYEKDTTISTSDGLTFEAKAGDYEILFIEEGTYIIPSLTGLVPSDGDSVILFNIKMPSEYTQSAYTQLEERLDKEIARMSSDLNNYTFKSNPVAFNENNPNLSIGRSVKFINGDYSYNTRVIKLTTHLDFPIEQEITIGNQKVKGNTQQLKEEVASANKDLNLLAVFNEMTQNIQQSYNRTQQMMLEGFAAIKNIWQLKETENGEKYAWSAFNVVTQQGITMYADNATLNLPSIYAGLPIDNSSIYWEEVENEDGSVTRILKAKGGGEGNGTISNVFITGTGNAITDVSLSSDKKSLNFVKGLTFVDKTFLLENYFTRDEASGLFVTLDEKEQEIIGVKTFLNGLKIGSSKLWQSQEDVIYLDANLVVRGGVTMYAQNNVDIPSFMESLLLDENTLKLDENGYLTVIGGAGGSIEHALTWSGFSTGSYDGKSAQNIYIPSKVSELTNDSAFITKSALSGYATQSWVNDKLDDYVTELGLESNGKYNQYLTYTKGGTVNRLTVGYASYANSLLAWGATDLNATGVWNTNIGLKSNWFSSTASNTPATAGTSANGVITFMPATSYGFQLAYLNQLSTGYDGVAHLFVRNYVNGSYRGWYRLVTDGPQMTFDTYASGYMRLRYLTQDWYYLRAYSDGLWIGLSNTVGARVDSGGNLLVTGGITMYSDQRKKTILRHVELSLKEVADAPLIEHYYNSDENKTTHVGSIAQYWAGLNDWFCKKDSEGFYTMEIQNCALASAISVARELDRYETKTDKTIKKLKKRICELEEEVERLKAS